MKIIGIAGGSGVGKSTVAYKLVDTYPERFEVLNLDDYQKTVDKEKPNADLPMVDAMINWDHPDAIRWDKLRKDIGLLSVGKQVQIDVWAHRSNPDYAIHHEKKPRIIYPRPVLIVEGYLALYMEVADIYNRSFYLDLDEQSRAERRRLARGGKDTIIGHDDYVEKVLQPMHKQFVEPTKANADFVVDVTDKSVDEIAEFILTNI